MVRIFVHFLDFFIGSDQLGDLQDLFEYFSLIVQVRLLLFDLNLGDLSQHFFEQDMVVDLILFDWFEHVERQVFVSLDVVLVDEVIVPRTGIFAIVDGTENILDRALLSLLQ